MKMYLAGSWLNGNSLREVRNPWSNEVVDTVPAATAADVERALSAAVDGAIEMSSLSGYQRADILTRAAAILEGRVEELARLVTMEEGKPLREARDEVARCPALLRLSAFEGSQQRGEVLPLDAAANGASKIGFALRVPCGVVVAITPFNYPLLLVLHKVAPALAAGNAVILKPASATPLVALKLVEVLLEAGLPATGLQCLTGGGSELGAQLCSDARVRKITFTGSSDVGVQITRVAGVKRMSLELGGNAPLVLLTDADIDDAAEQASVAGYSNAGQACISTQRVIAVGSAYQDFIDAITPKVGAISPEDPLRPTSRLAAMVSESEASRVEAWVREATELGARVVVGGERQGAVHQATVLAEVTPRMRVFHEELFGPAVTVTPARDADDALKLANSTPYGLSAAVFTSDSRAAWRFAHGLEAGVVYVNVAPPWRADFMPYGGLKQSGIGIEGPRYAVQEMTEVRTLVYDGR